MKFIRNPIIEKTFFLSYVPSLNCHPSHTEAARIFIWNRKGRERKAIYISFSDVSGKPSVTVWTQHFWGIHFVAIIHLMSHELPPLELFITPCSRNASNTLINTSSFYFYITFNKTSPFQESFGVDIPAFIQEHEQIGRVWGRREGKEMFINSTDKSLNWTRVGRNVIKTILKLIWKRFNIQSGKSLM